MNSRLRLPLPRARGFRRWRDGLIVVLTVGIAFTSAAQTDNFDDGNDTGWSKITNSAYPATYTFPADNLNGKAYRLRGGAPPEPWDDANTGRAIAYRSDRLYTNFFVAADILAWDGGHTNNLIMGIFGRGTPASIASGIFDAATMTVEINRFADASGSRGRAQVIALSAGQGGGPATLAECTVTPGRQYRLTLTGSNNVMTGAIYDLEDLTHPLLSMTGDDFFASIGLYGGPFPDPSVGGYSGLITYSSIGTGDTTIFAGGGTDATTDATFDNFVAAAFPPASVPAPGTPHGLAGAPQVVNRSPASFRNFYPASGGITFNATTLTTTNSVDAAAIRFYLNGADLSSQLQISGPATNLAVAYHSLASNAVYEARIELQDTLGRKTTNAWTFDTFSDAYLASGGTKTIECEDFDYGGGLYINDPVPSGYATNDYFPAFSGTTPFNLGTGYLDLDGVYGVDFYDLNVNPVAQENDFRFSDSASTTAGTVTHLYGDATLFPGSILYHRNFDTQRQKYANVSSNLHDYVLMRTEGGEWLNYTRAFVGATFYNAYLRYNSGLAQPLSLDQVSEGVITNHLGTFAIQASAAMGNNRFAPMLRDGRLATVQLSGTNTLRLTMTGPQNGSTKQRSAFNYLLLVPALLVESAPAANGPFLLEAGAAVEPGLRRIRIPSNGDTRFYRLRWNQPTRITNVLHTGGVIELTYE